MYFSLKGDDWADNHDICINGHREEQLQSHMMATKCSIKL